MERSADCLQDLHRLFFSAHTASRPCGAGMQGLQSINRMFVAAAADKSCRDMDTFMHIHFFMSICMYIYTSTCIYIYMYIAIYIEVRLYVLMYIQM